MEKIDGASFTFDDWSFNIRPSANDPVARLNIEGTDEKKVQKMTEEISGLKNE
ncbi:MAG: hypothetical protein COU31_01725 [Candidatus Magasanikbacteria bacterium CG10_big_fil_rev_8_21_14_0_10_40_10]|uniref:Alpha-D-phosphohexomutase C-terminal domain-containing protein n=1 Tax=Candidatus Magasanikbacteria bacterium CG10_big_fil_rev_8_21_14_0_10_40_10 TaxID=1974648 RepID=A0A2M6W4E4_9BACT|nr:MAG: hypothetical protein COU31_01725 [Candidatus Magasanikbacteria bacterium CG10_big_fil_rev_8_21_14_0_10_40_10]